MTQAQIKGLWLCEGHFEPMKNVEDANVIAGFGIEGNRHSTDGPRKARQILIMDEETLDNFGLEPGQIRENITISGIDLHSLIKGQRVSLGEDVVLEITGFCDPCTFIDGIRPGLREQMIDRRGMLAFAVDGGTIKVGDTVGAVETATA